VVHTSKPVQKIMSLKKIIQKGQSVKFSNVVMAGHLTTYVPQTAFFKFLTHSSILITYQTQ